jgi:hypothetical protein
MFARYGAYFEEFPQTAHKWQTVTEDGQYNDSSYLLTNKHGIPEIVLVDILGMLYLEIMLVHWYFIVTASKEKRSLLFKFPWITILETHFCL